MVNVIIQKAVLALLLVAVWSLAGQTRRPAVPAKTPVPAKKTTPSFDSAVQPFIANNCYGCHNGSSASGKLNLVPLKTAASVALHRDRWEVVLKRLQAGEMPPAPLPRPNSAELNAATTWIERELDRLDRLAKPDPGRVTARRLNRAEYNYTVKDLLGVDFRPADDFPQDDTGYGFDTIGDVLSLSVVQMEKYLSAAETVARTSVYGPPAAKPTMARYQPQGRRRPGDFDNLFFNTHPWLSVTNYDESGLSMPNTFHVTHSFPATAEYVIRATPDNGSRPPGSEPLEMAVFVDGKAVGTASIDGQLEGRTQEFRTKITAGEHWIAVGFPRQFEGLPVLYGAKNPSTRPAPVGGRRGGRGLAGAPGGGTPLAAPPAGRGGRGAASANNPAANNNDADSNVFFTPPGAPPGTRLARPDNMSIQSLEIGGPHNPEIRPSAVFSCDIRSAGCDRTTITNLARRAYRRPVSQQEIDELMQQMARVKRRGDPVEEQLVVGIESILVSPNFLFRIEKDRGPRAADA